MAVYQKLLYSAGGGIITPQKQVDQVKNTANILIGLGGTGIDCIRTIKTLVYERLKPDNEENTRQNYAHIRFLGVDSDIHACGRTMTDTGRDESDSRERLFALDCDEFFNIGNPNELQALRKGARLDHKPELSWLNTEVVRQLHMSESTGAIRQVGRFLMMEKAREFMARLEREINIAKFGMTDPRVCVHICSGLSGGTGSGCFLDVCYMIRSLAERIGGITLFGYFFLPDVNLQNVPFAKSNMWNCIQGNGYAALQELDYCMNLPDNGGSFEQIYPENKTIKWNMPPVDLCHLICATDRDNNVIREAYNYAMNVTAEYLMDFLTESENGRGMAEFSVLAYPHFGEIARRKTIGSQVAYCAIGGACACIPLREINTWLAAELFDRFGSIRQNVPGMTDVAQFAIAALAPCVQNIDNIYESIYAEFRKDARGSYNRYLDDCKSILNNGNRDLELHYRRQTAAQLNRIEMAARSMTDWKNPDSLLGKVISHTGPILRDINRGPIYACRLFSANAEHSFLHIVEGLIAENNARRNQEAAQAQLRMDDYESAMSIFLNRRRRSLFDNDEKRFSDYQDYLMLLEQHKLTMGIYERLDRVLRSFRDQIEELNDSWYRKLNRVMETLLNTFAENRNALADLHGRRGNDFEIPMIPIAELLPSLAEEVAKCSIPNMFDAFMDLLLRHEDAWIMEDSNRITRLIRDFFADTVCYDFAHKSITSFLRDHYERCFGRAVTDRQLSDYIYEDWMKRLTNEASPLFCFNPGIWREQWSFHMASISVPDSFGPIQSAADKIRRIDSRFQPRISTLTDRIYVMYHLQGFPISACCNCAEYERAYFSAREPGRHIYEGKPNPTIGFTDWNLLPSLIPQSCINTESENIPEILKKRIIEARQLFEEARKYGIIDEEGYVCRPERHILDQLLAASEAKLAGTITKGDTAALEAAVRELSELDQPEMERSSYRLPDKGYRFDDAVSSSILKDYFVSSPAIHDTVRSIVSDLEQLRARREEILERAESILSAVASGSASTES